VDRFSGSGIQASDVVRDAIPHTLDLAGPWSRPTKPITCFEHDRFSQPYGTAAGTRKDPELLMCQAASGWVVAIHSGDFITLAQLLACDDHPVRETEHGPLEETWAVHTGLEREPFQTDLFHLLPNSLTMIFSHELDLPVVHHDSFSETINSSD